MTSGNLLAGPGICATMSEKSSFFFGSPLLFSNLDRGNKAWVGQDDWAGWDDEVGRDNNPAGRDDARRGAGGSGQDEGTAETVIGLAEMGVWD